MQNTRSGGNLVNRDYFPFHALYATKAFPHKKGYKEVSLNFLLSTDQDFTNTENQSALAAEMVITVAL